MPRLVLAALFWLTLFVLPPEAGGGSACCPAFGTVAQADEADSLVSPGEHTEQGDEAPSPGSEHPEASTPNGPHSACATRAQGTWPHIRVDAAAASAHPPTPPPPRLRA